MKIELTNQESEQFFYNALCNGLSHFCSAYGFGITYKQEEYKTAKITANIFDAERIGLAVAAELQLEVCYEDVLMEMLHSEFTITFEDLENDGEYSRCVTLKDVHEKVCKAPFQSLMDMHNENDDAYTADTIIQAVLFDGEQIMG